VELSLCFDLSYSCLFLFCLPVVPCYVVNIFVIVTASFYHFALSHQTPVYSFTDALSVT